METAGTALKTVIARFSEVKKLYSTGELLGSDEEGEAIDVNKISTALRSVGINLNEYLTGMKGLDDIFIELASKWDSLDTVTQRYIATTAAGSRQQSRFLALMSDYGRTMELVNAANGSAGASQEQFNKTLDSLQAHVNKLKNAWNEFTMDLANDELIKGAIDTLTALLNVINDISNSLGSFSGLAKVGMAAGAFMGGRALFSRGISRAGALFRGQSVGGFKVKGFDINTLDTSQYQAYLKERDAVTQYYGPNGITKQLEDDWYKAAARSYDATSATEYTAALHEMQSTEQLLNDTKQEGILKMQALDAASKTSSIQTQQWIATAQGENLAHLQTVSVLGQEATMRYAAAEATGDQVGAQALLQESEIVNQRLQRGGIKGLLTKIGLQGKSAAATKLETELTEKQIIELQAKEQAQAAANKTMMIGAIKILAVIAVVVLLVKAYKAIAKAAHEASAEGRLEALQEATEQATEKANECKEAYDNLASSLDSLGEKYNQLETLTRGTQEWRDTVQDINSQVIELMENYEDLGTVTIDSNGVLRFDQEAALKTYNARRLATERAQIGAQLAELEGQRRLLETQTSIQRLEYTTRGEEYAEVQIKKLAGTEEEIAKALVDPAKFKNFFNTNIFDPTLESVNELLKVRGQEFDLTQKELDQLKAYGKELEELTNKSAAYRTTLEALTLSSMDLDEEQYNYAANFITDSRIANEIEKQKGKFYDSDGTTWLDFTTTFKSSDQMEQQRQYLQYFKDIYGEDTEIDGDGNIVFFVKTTDEEGKIKTEKHTLGYESAISQYATDKAIEVLASVTDEFLQQLAKVGDKTGATLKRMFEEAEGGALRYSDVINKATETMWSGDTLYHMGEEAYTELYEKAFDPSDEQAQKFVEDYVQRMKLAQAQISKATTALDQKGISQGLEDFTATELEGLSNAVKAMSGDTAKAYFDAIAKMSPEFQNIALTTDPKDINQLLSATEAMRDLGATEEEIQTYWDVATESAHTYIGTLDQVAARMDAMQQKIKGIDELKGKLIEGKASTEEITEWLRNGYIQQEDLQLTTEGWKLAEEAANEAAKKANEANLISAQEQLDVLQEEQEQFGKLGDSIEKWVKADDKYLQFSDIDKENQQEIGRFLLGGDADALGLSDAAWLAEAERAYNEYVEYRKNGEQTLFDTKSQLILAEATQYDTVAEARAAAVSDAALGIIAQKEAEALGLDEKELLNYADILAKTYNMAQGEAVALALKNTKIEKGLSNIVNKYEDWNKAIKKGINSNEYASAIKDIRSQYELLGLDVSKLSDEQLVSDEYFRQLKLIADGNTEALNNLIKLIASANFRNILPEQLDDGLDKTKDLINNWIDTVNLNTLEINSELNPEIYNAFNKLIEAGKITADEVTNLLSGMGYEPEIGYKKVSVPNMSRYLGDNGETLKGPLQNWVMIPYIKSYKYAGQTNIPPSSSSGGGSKSDKWQNPYDELYNLNEKINETLREREKLERNYERILSDRSKTAEELRQNSLDEIANLRRQLDLQDQLIAGRRKQLEELGQKTYTDSNGKESTYEALGVTKYARYNETTGLVEIEYAMIDAVNDSELGKAVEAYISDLEERSQQFEEAQDAREDMVDQLKEVRERGMQEYLELEQRVYDALVDAQQKIIDNYQTLSDEISDSNNKVIENLQKQIDLERQIRDNTKTEEEIADKEARLAYLRRDTSGANAVEIMQLQEEIDEARQSYEDTLIDQAIQKLTDENQLAADQRAMQIDIMQHQLEYAQTTGTLWEQVYQLIDGAMSVDGKLLESSELVKTLQQSDTFKGLSYFGRQNWINEMAQEWKAAQEGNRNWRMDEARRNGIVSLSDGTQLFYDAATDSWGDSAGNIYSSVDWSGYGYTGTKSAQVTPSDGTGTTSEETGPGILSNMTNQAYNFGQNASWTSDDTKQLQAGLNNLINDGQLPGITEALLVDGIYGAKTRSAVLALQRLLGFNGGGLDGDWGPNTKARLLSSNLRHYATGGIVDFTGPAWLDGSRSNPELVLNARDTQNFIALRDILGNFMRRNDGTSFGDNYFDIDINVDEIGSDYDVNQMATQIREQIIQDANYRNVNAINYLR